MSAAKFIEVTESKQLTKAKNENDHFKSCVEKPVSLSQKYSFLPDFWCIFAKYVNMKRNKFV